MTTLVQQIEEMRLRLNELAHNEQGLVRALGDALSRADQQLLQDVRNLAVEHEARRGAILKELQGLATRICTLPAPEPETYAALNEAPRDLPPYDPTHPTHQAIGDWRLAANNIQDDFQDELDFRLNGRAAAGH